MDSNKTRLSAEKPPNKLETSGCGEGDAFSLRGRSPDITSDSDGIANFSNFAQNKETILGKDSERQNESQKSDLTITSYTKGPPEADSKNSSDSKSGVEKGSLMSEEVPLECNSVSSGLEKNDINCSASNGKLSEVIIKTSKPLCADYQSDSESIDSESDSSTSIGTSTEASSDSEFESGDSCDSGTPKGKTSKGEKKLKEDLALTELPPIENLKITVPEDACVEIGTITSIVETLVIVESYKGTSALDIDTVLFLDCGRQTLGKVFDILGPVSEPVYAVRFNSQEQIKSLNIKTDMKVYYAPKTEHTTFVFMSEVLKHRGSDASWKDNVEAPPEFQDFSDDEEERRHKNKQTRDSDRENCGQREQNKSRKRPFNKVKQPPRLLQGTRFQNSNFCQHRPQFQRNVPLSQFSAPPPFPRPNYPLPHAVHPPIPPFPYNVPPYSGADPLSRPPPPVFPPRLSGPPFPTFGGLPVVGQSQSFHQPFYQQRTHAFPQGFGGWGRPMFRPPPPPPPPADQSDRQAGVNPRTLEAAGPAFDGSRDQRLT